MDKIQRSDPPEDPAVNQRGGEEAGLVRFNVCVFGFTATRPRGNICAWQDVEMKLRAVHVIHKRSSRDDGMFYRTKCKYSGITPTVIHNLHSISNTHLQGDNSQYIVMATTLLILTTTSTPTEVPQQPSPSNPLPLLSFSI